METDLKNITPQTRAAIFASLMCLPHAAGPLGAMTIEDDADFGQFVEPYRLKCAGIVLGRGFHEHDGKARTAAEHAYLLTTAMVHVMMGHPNQEVLLSMGDAPVYVDRAVYDIAAQTVAMRTVEHSDEHISGMFQRPADMPDLVSELQTILELDWERMRSISTLELHDLILGVLEASDEGVFDDLKALISKQPIVLDGCPHDNAVATRISQALSGQIAARKQSHILDEVARETGIVAAIDDDAGIAQLVDLIEGRIGWDAVVDQMPVVHAMMAWPRTIEQGRQALALLDSMPPARDMLPVPVIRTAVLEMVLRQLKRAGLRTSEIKDAFHEDSRRSAVDMIHGEGAVAVIDLQADPMEALRDPVALAAYAKAIAEEDGLIVFGSASATGRNIPIAGRPHAVPEYLTIGEAGRGRSPGRPRTRVTTVRAHGRRPALVDAKGAVIATISRWGSEGLKVEVAMPETVAELAAALPVTIDEREGGGDTTLGAWLALQATAGALIVHQR